MDNANQLRSKLRNRQTCLGSVITFTDATVTEALSGLLDFVWIDTEHNALSLETVQAHLMATRGTETTTLVRVPWNDPVLIKPVLDIGADGVIVPFVRTVDDVRRAVAACRYPPDGIRGYGPRRPTHYGRLGGPEYCRLANETIFIVVQIEHIDAVNNIDDIVRVPGLTSIVLGPNDLSGSMGLMGQSRHPKVLQALETVITKARQAGLFVGIGIGDDPAVLMEWADKGVQWLTLGNDYSLLLRAAQQVSEQVRAHARSRQ
jgi:2-dehydro-3-deoxyglucarate aldolase/4-hydroxy-2-oxoheptanedioate aldolase